MKVRAIQLGYDGRGKRRILPGEVFELLPFKGRKPGKDGALVEHLFTPEEQFSEKWMELVDEEELVKKPKKLKPELRADHSASDSEVI